MQANMKTAIALRRAMRRELLRKAHGLFAMDDMEELTAPELDYLDRWMADAFGDRVN